MWHKHAAGLGLLLKRLISSPEGFLTKKCCFIAINLRLGKLLGRGRRWAELFELDLEKQDAICFQYLPISLRRVWEGAVRLNIFRPRTTGGVRLSSPAVP